MPRKVKLILNPIADMGRAWKTANDLRPIAQEFQGDLSWSGTVYPTHAIELARQAGRKVTIWLWQWAVMEPFTR